VNIELYTKDNCIYCQESKIFLTTKNIPFSEKKLGVDFTREMILEQFPTARTFPIVVVDGFNIGGYTNLREHVEKSSTNTRLLNE